MYFSICEASTLIDLFFVKGKIRALSMCGKKYNSIPNNRVAGEEVSTTTGFNSLKENGCPS